MWAYAVAKFCPTTFKVSSFLFKRFKKKANLGEQFITEFVDLKISKYSNQYTDQ